MTPQVTVNFETFQTSVDKEKQVTRSLATEAMNSIKMLALYHNDPLIKHYEIDVNDTGKFLFWWIYQIENDFSKKLSIVLETNSVLNSCKLLSVAMENIQKNLDTISEAQSDAQKRLFDAEALMENFLEHIKSDKNLKDLLMSVDLTASVYENLTKVIEIIKEYFILESPGLIAMFAEAFVTIHESLRKTSEIYDEYFSANINNSQNLLNIYSRNC